MLFFAMPFVSLAQPADSLHFRLDTVFVNEVRVSELNSPLFGSHASIQSTPGTLQDPARYVILTPQAVVVSDIQAIPSLAGDEPDRILVTLNGFPLVMPYRLLGTFSLFNSLFTKGIHVSHSGYSAQYGSRFASVVAVETEKNYSDESVAQGEFTLPVSSIALGVPLNDSTKTYLRLALRASHIQAVSPFVSEATRERLESFIPVLRDGQFLLTMSPLPNMQMNQLGIYSNERGSLLNLNRTFDYTWQKVFLGNELLFQLGPYTLQNRLSWAHDDVLLATVFPLEIVGDKRFATDGTFNVLWWDISLHNDKVFGFEKTLGVNATWNSSRLQFASFSDWLNKRSPTRSSFTDLALYASSTFSIAEGARLNVGLRFSHYGFVQTFDFEPRFNFETTLWKNARLTLSLGRYLQPPSDFQLLHGFLSFLAMPGQPPRLLLASEQRSALVPEQSDVGALTLRQSFHLGAGTNMSVAVDCYYKNEQNLILSARYPSVFTPLDSNSYEPRQKFSGHKYGVGVSFNIEMPRNHVSFSGSLFSHRSSLFDIGGKRWYPAANDLPFALKLIGKAEFDGWKVSLALQMYSGAPTTEQYYEVGRNLFGGYFYFPLWKDLNSARLPAYSRVDLSASKSFELNGWQFIPFAEIINLLNSKNVSQFTYEFSEFSDERVAASPVYNSFPLLPMIGLRLKREW